MENLHGRELIDAIHPLHEASRQHSIYAGQELRELVRYLNHATCDRAGREAALPSPAIVDSVAWSLQLTLEMLPQLMRQMGIRLSEFRAMPRFGTDDGDKAKAKVRALAAENQLFGIAVALEGLARNMYAACQETTHLNFD